MYNKQVIDYAECLLRHKQAQQEQAQQTHKKLIKDQKRLPNSYNRHKQSRLYCYTKDKHLQQLSGDTEFWLSMYSGKQYVYKLVLGSTQTKDKNS